MSASATMWLVYMFLQCWCLDNDEFTVDIISRFGNTGRKCIVVLAFFVEYRDYKKIIKYHQIQPWNVLRVNMWLARIYRDVM